MRFLAGILTAASLCLAAVAGPHAGYLPAVGPVPLRFQAPATTPNLALLPPLVMEDSRPPALAEGGPARLPLHLQTVIDMMDWLRTQAPATPAPLAQLPPSAATNSVTTNALPPADPNLANAPVETSDLPAMSPQMLMQFFKQRGGRQPQTTVVVPQGFTPPPPAAPRSSTATFNTP
jgi:hypothetical protein